MSRLRLSLRDDILCPEPILDKVWRTYVLSEAPCYRHTCITEDTQH